ncbi:MULTISPECIES: DUF2911 domain-containing protein [Roseivirga]|uniref:DUF2911 domain-containing protein n=1 Tax=Roseivirga spongicola TaxID=333140 RepID=A0A150XGW7_9BACT|nr:MULTISPECIES: DUF2911 domain-containing protein [Roseivirga]KYG77952.1 hypothetical protein AWW68_04060 [Roseivirga spongicola]MBO6661235.1 DUF2911 domain-containing protein [Roseivirga sp.]MBO6761150.1 DUF2911 domain-containing protein [Roseivirga sp.]MBO6908781.1 DUF2911 domain-containing protein [Roseivirga sp.]WPZ11682.1 DUF2911 domain-containing protein [Roseivirga spongicola]
MSRRLLYILGAIFFLVLAIVGFNQYRLYQTKQYSPEETAEYISTDVAVKVFYNRPSKKGRVIFGDLVPYGEWWRTGANEATQIELTRDIRFENGETLSAGKYSLVTIPNANEWQVIFNSKIPDWGTDYDPQFDVLNVVGHVERLPQTVEVFTIDFTEENGQPRLTMAWDNTKVTVPFWPSD